MMQTRVDPRVKCEHFGDKGPGDHAQGMRNRRIILPPKANKVTHATTGCTSQFSTTSSVPAKLLVANDRSCKQPHGVAIVFLTSLGGTRCLYGIRLHVTRAFSTHGPGSLSPTQKLCMKWNNPRQGQELKHKHPMIPRSPTEAAQPLVTRCSCGPLPYVGSKLQHLQLKLQWAWIHTKKRHAPKLHLLVVLG